MLGAAPARGLAQGEAITSFTSDVTIAPDGAEESENVTYHYHYVESAEPAGPPQD